MRPSPKPCKVYFERDPLGPLPRCFDAALPGHEYCRPHKREHAERERKRTLRRFNQWKWYNRRQGKCWCGAEPIEGRRVCFVHHAVEIESRERKRRAVKSLPPELRRYVTRGRRGHLGAMDMQRWEIERVRRKREARRPAMSRLANDMQRSFVAYLVEQGQRNAERAALRAGYGVVSAANGGRAAAVAGCRLLKRTDIQAAIREYRGEVNAARKAAAHEQESREVRAAIAEFLPALEAQAVAAGPQSVIAREIRRARGQAMLRLPGHCRCGAVADPGLKSCAPCRRERRHYRRRQRARRRLLRIA